MTVTQHVRMKRNHMATTFEFVVSLAADRGLPLVFGVGNQAQLATDTLTHAHQVVAQLEDELSEYRPQSPVRLLNESPRFERVAMPPSVLELLRRSEQVRVASQSHFDYTIKGPRGQISWDATHAWRTHGDAHLGFGAIGKGFALDRARAVVEAAGFGDYLLSGGGSSVILSGFAAPEDPWSFGWSWKKDEQGEDLGIALRHASGRPIALGISGTHEKGAHILGLATGAEHFDRERVSNGASAPTPASALIGAASATDADAWSTALFVAGFERGVALLTAAADVPGGWSGPSPAVAQIEADGTPRWNGIFQHLWGAPS